MNADSRSLFAALNLRNVVWLLVFCPHLSQAALRASISTTDFRLLLEFSDTFAGLSKIKELAIHYSFIFTESDKRTWWGLAGKEQKSLKGNEKTDTQFHYLKVTNQLKALELAIGNRVELCKGDTTYPLMNCLYALDRSAETLTHLRLSGVQINFTDPFGFKYLVCSSRTRS